MATGGICVHVQVAYVYMYPIQFFPGYVEIKVINMNILLTINKYTNSGIIM